jgi:hypothetical protein
MKFNLNIGVWHILTIVFVILKLAHCINCSWWTVLAPSYVMSAIALFLGWIGKEDK